MELSTAQIPRRTTLLYLLLATTWILLSDKLLALFISPETEPILFANAQTFKGWLFVAVTAVSLFILLRRQLARLQAETAVRFQLQHELEALLEAMPLAVIQMDGDGIVQYWNQPAEEMFGWTAEEAVGRFLPYVSSDKRDEFAALRQRVLAGESLIDTEVERETKTKQAILLSVSISPVRRADGAISGIMSIAKDITSRQQAQTALRESEIRYRSLIEYAPNAIFVNYNDQIVLVNQATVELFGAQSERDLLGKSPFDLFHPDYHAEIRQRIHQHRHLGQSVRAVEEKIVRLDGSVVEVEVSAAPFPYEGGTAVHVIVRDVTARKQTERENFLLLTLPNAIADAPSWESALESALSLVCTYAAWDLGEVWVPTAGEPAGPPVLKLLAQHHQHPEQDAEFWPFSQQFTFGSGASLPGQVWSAQDLVWMPDVAENAGFTRAEMAAKLDFHLAMGLPIVVDGVLTAVMCFFSRKQRTPDDRLVSLMSSVTVQINAAFQRRQYQERLYQSQQLAQTTIDSLSEHIAVLDEEGTIIGVNQSWLKFAQENNADLTQVGIGTNYLAVCANSASRGDADAAKALTSIQSVMRGEKAEMFREYTCHGPHHPRWFIARITPLPGSDPRRRRVVVAHENVTSLKLAQEALRESEQHYRLLFDNNPQPMWVYDLETLSFLAVNDAAIERYGYTHDEFLKMTIKEIRPSEDIPRLLADVAQTRPALQRSGEWRHQLKDGRVIDVEIASHTLNFDGREAALVVAFDITERKQAAADRLAQTQRLQEILDTVPEGVVLLEENGRVILVNPQGRQLLFELCGAGLGDQIEAINDLPLAQLLASSENGSSHAIQTGSRYFELLSRPITPQTAGSNWVLLLRDVSKDHEREQYQQAQDRLATVGQLAAGIAHDFNNVLAIIILYAQLLQSTADLPPKGQSRLDTIITQAQHAANMIAQILDFSRRSVMERTPVALLPLVKEMIKLLQNTLPETIQIELEYEAGDYVVQADPTRLKQVLMNTAVNARDAMPEGGNLLFALTTLHVTPSQPSPLPDMGLGDWLRLTITDTGTGIPPENLPRIFDPFFTTKAPGKGTGLGLAQLYGIVKQHEGSVSVDSQVGKGTTFTIYLPLYSPRTDDTRSASASGAAPVGTETILLVEDNPMLRASVADVLFGLGYQVLQAENGVEALSILSHEPEVDLVLSDMVMPEMGGVDLHRRLHRDYPALPLLLMTGYPLGERDAELADMAWIIKPFSARQLGYKVRALLDQSSDALWQ